MSPEGTIPLAPVKTRPDSFRVHMMAYPVLNRFEKGTMLYLRKTTLVRRNPETGAAEHLEAAELVDLITEHYDMARPLVQEALRLMRQS